MLSKTITFATCLGLSFAQTSPAPVIINNQFGQWYVADLMYQHGPGNVTGSIGISGDVEGKGVRVSYEFEGFDLTDSKEYSYHIHEDSVPEDGNCNSTGKHFDIYAVGDDFVCDKAQPQYCQLGDLAGKHGSINFNDPVSNLSDYAYHDDYLSITPGDPAFFGDLSIVVHRKADKFRLACGNFRLFYDANTHATVGPMPAETAILGNETTTGAPFPNATTSTNVVFSTTYLNQTSSASTVTQVATVPAESSVTATNSATSTKSGPLTVHTGSAERGHRIQRWAVVMEISAVAFLASYFG